LLELAVPRAVFNSDPILKAQIVHMSVSHGGYETPWGDNLWDVPTWASGWPLDMVGGRPSSKEPGHTGIAGRVDLGVSDNAPSSKMAPDRSSATTLVTGFRVVQLVPVVVRLTGTSEAADWPAKECVYGEAER